MKSIYTIESTQRLIDEYLNEGGSIFQMQEGVLGLGDFVLYDMGGRLKTYIVHEVVLNEWSSGQSIRAYNRMPEKYRAMIERG